MKCFKLLMAVLVFCLFTGSALAGEFSADVVRKGMGETMQGKLYVKDMKFREEMSAKGQGSIMVIDMLAQKSLMIIPAQKMYMEMQYDPTMVQDKKAPQELEKEMEVKNLGTETVNGYVCDKIQYSMKDQSTTVTWHSKELGYSVRSITKSKEGEMTTELSNIKEGGVADSMFVAPAGYTKMQMPNMGGKGPKTQ